MNTSLDQLFQMRDAESRSITAENPTGARGKGGMETPPKWTGEGWNPARELGQGWKVRPAITIDANATTTIADVEGPGVIRHIWMTLTEKAYRNLVLRVYWDGSDRTVDRMPHRRLLLQFME